MALSMNAEHTRGAEMREEAAVDCSESLHLHALKNWVVFF